MKIAIALLLKDMLKKISIKNMGFSKKPAIMVNIKKIQTICNKDYFNQSFYGSAALNRKMLLDKRIADLLTPETIVTILSLHNETTHLDKHSAIAIWRNSTGYVSLAAALFYGFNEGLETIELMPNNESRYGSKRYQEQKKQFKKNTYLIIENIKKAAELVAIPFKEDQLPLEGKEQSLTALFQSVEQTIAKIKRDNKSNKLLFVPTYTSEDIREQSRSGFATICTILNLNYTVNNENDLVVEDSISLEEFIKTFLSSEETLLNGTVIHLFYDRAHLEACIEQNSKIIFQNKVYYFRDILRHMVTQCETDASVCKTAKEQFGIRLKLCDVHLKENFSSYYTVQHDQPETQAEDNVPFGYKQIKMRISVIDSEIDKSLWTCNNLKKCYAEKDFLEKIIEFYDHSEGKLPLKKCLLLAKWQNPQGYQHVLNQRGTNVLVNVLNENTLSNPTQGPRLKNNASIALEKLLHALLSDYKTIECSINVLKEAEICIDGNFFNITQILMHDPDFEHIQFTEEQLAKYANFAVHAQIKPTLNGSRIPTDEDYNNIDTDNENSHYHYGEKLAITIYSSNFYREIQDFLRAQGRTQSSKHVTEILLSAAVAAHGLAKPTLNPKEKGNLPSCNYRTEIASQKAPFFKKRLESIQTKSPLFEKGFLSTSSTNKNDFFQGSSNTHTVFYEERNSNTLGKNIKGMSEYTGENEVLYGPGTQLHYTDYHKEGTHHFFAARPIRSLDGIKPNNYSNAGLIKHELEIIDKMFEIYLNQNKHSRFRQWFDTVSNVEKLQCVHEAKTKIKMIFDTIPADGQLNAEQLIDCQKAIQTGIEKNRVLVSNAYWPASLGKTDKVLQDALLRVSRAINLVNHDEALQILEKSQLDPSKN